MDSISGHSEGNQQKIIDGLKLIKVGKSRKIKFDELPYKKQEEIRGYMDMMGEEEPPNMYAVDLYFEVEDYNVIPIELIATSFRDAIQEDRFEDAEKFRKIVLERDYSIEITDKMLILKANGKGNK